MKRNFICTSLLIPRKLEDPFSRKKYSCNVIVSNRTNERIKRNEKNRLRVALLIERPAHNHYLQFSYHDMVPEIAQSHRFTRAHDTCPNLTSLRGK